MKLLNKTSRYYVFIALPVFIAGGLILFFVIRFLMDGEATEQLYVEKQKVLDYFAANETIPDVSLRVGDEIFIVPSTVPVTEKVKDTTIYVAAQQEETPYRQIIFPVSIKNNLYAVCIRTTLYENDELLSVILLSTLGLMAILFLVFFMLNRRLSQKLWLPFYETLNKLNLFQLSASRPLQLTSSDIDEFKSLNETLLGMASKMQRDYHSLKEFSENASHELQTPLAVIQSKIELLMQSENLKENELSQLQTIHDNIQRLSKINRSLLLLSKIENRQFQQTETIQIKKIIEEKLMQWQELLAHHHLTIERNLDEPAECEMDATLAETLVGNLLSNAIRHNEGDQIRISTEKNSFTISNTGAPLSGEPEKLFERFKKEKYTNDSPGLGLAIVKEICKLYHFLVSYHFENGWHVVTVNFS